VPPMKEAVEEAFTAGLVKSVFATETLSLGINMPARSVVIEKLSKFTGEHHEFLTPGEYTQLAGRAGRRGLDEVGFVVVLVLDALILLLASEIDSSAIHVTSFGWALVAALVISAAVVVLDVILGANDDDAYALRVIARVARRQGGGTRSDTPGLLFLEIDGLALPVLQRAMRDGNVPELARWVQSGTHRLAEWETDLSSQTGASQTGILLGSNEDIPAFRWVEKDTGKVVTCSSPADFASSSPPATSLPRGRLRPAAFWAAVERDGARWPALPSPL